MSHANSGTMKLKQKETDKISDDPRNSGRISLQKLLHRLRYQHPLNESILTLRDEISQFLFISDAPQPVDLCVVLGAPSFTNIDPAIFLYQSGFVKNIIISGFGPKGMETQRGFVPEYAGLRERALDAGIPAHSVFVEKTAANTLENFVKTAELIKLQFGWENTLSVAIAGKPLHMRRALMTARCHWPNEVKLLMQPTTGSTDLQSTTWWQSEQGQQRVLTELRSIGIYSLRGDIGEI